MLHDNGETVTNLNTGLPAVCSKTGTIMSAYASADVSSLFWTACSYNYFAAWLAKYPVMTTCLNNVPTKR